MKKVESKEILVVVKNKLMSITTILPILIELKEKYNVSSTIIVNDKLAHKGINENVVIRDAVDYVGTELYTEPNSSNKIIRKFLKIKLLFFLLFKLIKGTKVLHFGIFNVFPFSVIGRAFGKNLYFFQSSSFKHSFERFDALSNRTPSIATPIGRNIVAFNDAFRYLNVVRESQRVFMFGSTRTRVAWKNYINQRSDDYFNKYHGNVDLANGCIVIMLSSFEELRHMRLPNEGLTILFKRTIEVLDKIKGNIPVFLKPHVFTDINIVNKAIHGRNGFYMTYLHQSVLASKAKVFICNSYSSTMADAKSLGVRTIEYSDYNNDVLKLSEGKSMGYEYVDDFINNDKGEFEKLIKSILFTDSPSKNRPVAEDIKTDADKLLTILAESN